MSAYSLSFFYGNLTKEKLNRQSCGKIVGIGSGDLKPSERRPIFEILHSLYELASKKTMNVYLFKKHVFLPMLC